MARRQPWVLETVSREEPQDGSSQPRTTENRDRKERLLDLANNNSVLDLKHSAASIWLLNPSAGATANLANNNSVPAQVWVIEPLPRRKGPGRWNLANNNGLVFRQHLPDNRIQRMLTSEQINDLHRLYWAEHWPIRKIERHLNMGWQTIKKYLDAPAQGVTKRQRQQ